MNYSKNDHMKIKLIYPPRIRNKEQRFEVILPPLGISILTSYLRKKGINTKQDDLDIKLEQNKLSRNSIYTEPFTNKKIVYDYILKDKHDNNLLNAAEKLLKLTDYKNFDLIGFSIMDNVEFSNISISLVLAKLIKEKTCTQIVIGGNIHPFHNFQDLPFVDYVIKNDGREPLLQLCNLIDAKKEKEYTKLRFYDKKEGTLANPFPYPERNSIVISNEFFTIPDFDGLPLDLYTSNINGNAHNKKKDLILPYNFGFGCMNECIFCPESGMACARFNKPSIIAEDLKYLADKYKTKTFYFINNLINPTYDYANEICKNFFENNLNIKWTDCISFKNLDIKLLKKLRESGAIRLVFGLETGSKRLLDYIKKGTSLKHAQSILKYSHNLGVWNCVELITGLPYEKNSDIKDTLNFIKKNQRYVNEFKLNEFHLTYSKLYSNPEKYGIKILPPVKKERFDTNQQQIRFKETRGKGEREKLKQIKRSYEIIRRCIQKNYKLQPHIEVLFQINSFKKSNLFIKNSYESIWGKNNPKECINRKIQRAEFIQELILKTPDNETLWDELTKIYRINKKIEVQLKIAPKINLKKEFDQNVLRLIIKHYLGLKEYRKAKERLKKLIKKEYFNKEEILLDLARCYWECKEYKLALKNYKKVLAYNQSNSIAVRGIGECYTQLQEYKKASVYLKKAIKKEPRLPWTSFDLGKAYYNLAKYKKSIQYLEKELKNSQEELSKFHSLYYLTMNYQKLGGYKKAKEYFRKVKKFKKYYNKEEITEEKKFKKELFKKG